MHVELLVPGLLSLPEAPRTPSLEFLLARGRATRGDPRSAESWLRDAFGLDSLPAGALSVAAPGAATWTRADPVHLRLLRDRVVIVPAEAFDLPAEEAGALVEALNRHFGEGLAIEMHSAARWAARLAAPIAVPDEPALQVAGRAAEPGMQGGALLTEIQMVLHAHPVNEAREARGEPPVNSLWLWGAGAAPQHVQARWQSLTAGDPLVLGLARAAALRARPPAPATQWLDRVPEEGRHLVVLDALRAPAALGDADALSRMLAALEEAWFAPVLAALRAGRVGMVTVHVPDAARALSVEAIRGDLRRIWRRPRPLSAWMG